MMCSRFTKNLSPDKIQISTLKGEGELSNLELDEMVLMDVMDLPTWMKLTKAFCNRVSIKVINPDKLMTDVSERVGCREVNHFTAYLYAYMYSNSYLHMPS